MKSMKIQSILLILSSCKSAILSLRCKEFLKFRLTTYHSKNPLSQLICTTHIVHLSQTKAETGLLSSVSKPQKILFSLHINLKHITTKLPRSELDFVSNICHVRFFHIFKLFFCFSFNFSALYISTPEGKVKEICLGIKNAEP